MNKKIMLMLGVVATLILCSQAADRYVDQLLGHDSYAGSLAKPKKTIQAAINIAVAGDVIHVAPGTYAPIVVDRQITIIATKGPHKTFIDGSNKYRCAKFNDVIGYELRGFTLQNGYSGKDHGGGAYKGLLRNCIIKDCRTFNGHNQFGGGGAYMSHLYDCIVEGCHAGFGGAMHEGLAHRCTFRNNYAMDRGGALWNVYAHQSLIHGNICDNFGGLPGGGGAHGCHLYNCTVTRNVARRLQGAGGLHECWSYNCIVWGNHNPNFPAYHEYRNPMDRLYDHYLSDPRFMHPDHPLTPDFHLRHDSPCRRVGNIAYWMAGPDHWDRDRNPRFHNNGTKIDVGCYEEDEELNSVKDNKDGTYTIKYNPNGEEFVTVKLDGETLISSCEPGEYLWQPQALGWHTNVFAYGVNAITTSVHVTKFPYAVQKDPEPPMPLDNDVVIAVATRNVKQTGGVYSLATVNSTADWTAESSDSWIVMSATSGQAGKPVSYSVGMNTNAEQRVGYVYVSGHVHTITQPGVGVTLDKGGDEFTCTGGVGTVSLTINERHVWKARPNCDWISVMPTNGMSSGTVTYTVAPLYDVTTRSGTITVGGNTFTVFQYGRRMGLSTYSETRDYYTHVIPITVDALAITEWEVTPNNSWISVVDDGSGKGGDLVTIAISENPSFAERTGTVTIGTETFRITQEGRTDVEFSINPTETTGSANGANGLLAITATPDLPWVAESQDFWLTIAPNYSAGAGNGNVAFTVNPNTTVYDRTGKILITPDQTSGLPLYTNIVHQPAATVAVAPMAHEYAAAGEAKTVTVTVAPNVQWRIEGVEDIAWLSISGSGATDYMGTQTITLAASANDSIFPRSGEITIAGKRFTVEQLGRGVEIEYESRVYGTDSDFDSISVHPDGQQEWHAVASDPDWIDFPWGDSGVGDGELVFTITDYFGDGLTRTGTITIGNLVVQITQTAYKADISPKGDTVTGNSGAGQISVSADIGAIWTAIATEPWITITTGYDEGTGSGTVRFTYTENNTGKTRTGKITINGTEYTLTQQARTMVAVNGVVDGHGGTIANAGSYDLGAMVQLEAVPDSGYRFLYWTLPNETESMVNPISVTADVAKTYTAKFEPLKPELTSVVSGTDGVTVNWQNLAWALKYHIYRGSSNVPAEAIKIDTIDNTGSATYLDTTGDIDLSYFYWVEAEGMDDLTMSSEAMAGTHQKLIVISKISYQNLKGATHSNPSTYTEEHSVVFTVPTSTVEGYVFAGWSPASIGTETRGNVIVEALWTANSYTVVYNANNGSGTMPNTAATYDQYVSIPTCGFTRTGYTFIGWSTTANGTATYQPGDSVKNLTAAQNGVVTLYAVWQINTYLVNGEEVTYGTSKKFTAPAPTVDGEGTTQYACIGTSAYPDRGTEFNITVTENIDFAWDLIRTNYWLEVEAPEHGVVKEDDAAYVDRWVAAGEEVSLVAEADTDYVFSAWYGETEGCTIDENAISAVMDGPRVLGATFEYSPVITEVADPVISPANGATFTENSCEVTLTCATPGASIFFSTNGVTPKTTEKYRYTGAFTISETTTIKAIAAYEEFSSDYVEATITKVVPTPPADPVITPADGSSFVGNSCEVTISCATDGAVIYYSTTGTPKIKETYRYTGPFTITDTTTIMAVAVKNDLTSDYIAATITRTVLTLAQAVDAPALTFTTGGDANFEAVSDANAKVGTADARSGDIGDEQTSWLETSVTGAGTFSFWWKVSCENDPMGAGWDHLEVLTNGITVAAIDGTTAWAQMTFTFADGTNTIRWRYVKDDSDDEGEDCGWVDGVVWTPVGAPASPTISGDANATVTGNAENGFVVKPGAENTSVDVSIPNGVDAGKVTVEVSTAVIQIKPHGAKIKIKKGVHDITDFLDIPAADGSGTVDLSKASVKEAIVKETLDPTHGADIDLSDTSNIKLQTSNTRPGLTYTLREGTTLKTMSNGASKLGDGTPWTPTITVKGGKCGFYSIGVSK